MAETSAPASPWSGVRASRRVSLRASFSWTFVGNSVYSACQWGVLILLAKFSSPSVVGQYALGFAIVMPIISFFNLQLRQVIASDVRQEYHFREYLGFRIVSVTLALVVIVFISRMLHYDAATTKLILLIGLSQAVEALSDVLYARLQFVDRMDQIAGSQLARGPLSLLALLAALTLTANVAWGVIGMLLARTFVLLVYDMRICIHALKPSFASPGINPLEPPGQRSVFLPMGRMLVLALPLGVVALLVNLSTNVPRYFIEHSLGRSELGIFSALAFIMSVGNLFAAALAQSTFVRMATQFAAGHLRDFRRLLLRLLGLGTGVGVAGILIAQFAGSQLITIVYGPEYAGTPQLLVGLTVVAWLSYLGQFLGCAMTAARYFRSQIPLFALVVLVIAMGSYWLIPRFALSGAVVALLLGTLTQLAGSVAILLFAMRRRRIALAGGPL